MADKEKVAEEIKTLLASLDKCLEVDKSAGYEAVQAEMRSLDAVARETAQAKFKSHYGKVLEKLELGRPLDTNEKALVHFFAVGEAAYYVRHENDVVNWKNELRRLQDEIRKVAAGNLDNIDSLLRLRAFARDAMNVLPDLAVFAAEKERAGKFEGILSGQISTEHGRIIADLIREKMKSERV